MAAQMIYERLREEITLEPYRGADHTHPRVTLFQLSTSLLTQAVVYHLCSSTSCHPHTILVKSPKVNLLRLTLDYFILRIQFIWTLKRYLTYQNSKRGRKHIFLQGEIGPDLLKCLLKCCRIKSLKNQNNVMKNWKVSPPPTHTPACADSLWKE